MWFSFRLGRHARVGLPWWLVFLLVPVIVAAAVVYGLAWMLVRVIVFVAVSVAMIIGDMRRGGGTPTTHR